MDIAHNVSLANYSTMRLGGIADHLAEVRSREQLQQTLQWASEQNIPAIVIGGGSNIIWQDGGFRGLVIVNKITGYDDKVESSDIHLLHIGAGEQWDSIVSRSVASGLTGIEALSLIPGTAGATPVQNVGAYGQEIAQTLVGVDVYDTQTNTFETLAPADCGFSYRTSRFKTDFRRRYAIVGLTLRLIAGNPPPPFYGGVQAYFAAHPIDGPVTPMALREAVIAIRRAKLPDPATVANNGSFFANPLIDQAKLEALLAEFPDMPNWPLADGSAKLPAAWLIEQTGFKDYHDEATGMATWPTQPLVLVNEHAHTTADLLAFKQKIMTAVEAKFGVTLTQEPELLP